MQEFARRTGAARVWLRVARWKSAYLIVTVTVRPNSRSPAHRRRSVTCSHYGATMKMPMSAPAPLNRLRSVTS